jgi:transposase-like protein
MATYKRHSTALKLQLVHAYLNGEGSYKELAAKHSIDHSLLVLWVQKFQRGEITEEQDQYLQAELRTLNETLSAKQLESVQTHQENARLLGDLSRAQGDLHQSQEEVRGLRPLKDELAFAQRRTEELGRHLVEQDAAVKQLGASNEQLQAKVDELLTMRQQLELALATARSSVTAQEQVVASMLARLTATSPEPDLAAEKGAEVGILGDKKPVRNPTGTGT